MCDGELMQGKRGCATRATVILVAVAVVLLVLWVQLPGPYAGYSAVKARLWNTYNLLKAYDELNGHLPAAISVDRENGEHASWRIAMHEIAFSRGLLRWKKDEVAPRYDRQKPWHHPQNLRLQGINGFYFDHFQYAPGFPDNSVIFATYYKAITGVDTAFDSDHGRSLEELPHDVILLVRVERSDTHWMEPGDLTIDEASSSDGKGLLLGRDGYAVLFADGAIWLLSARLPFSDLATFFTITGAAEHDREEILGPYRLYP